MAGEATKMSSDTKGKAIESALANIEKKFGKGSIMRLGERPHEEVSSISTNCLSIDAAIGVGGFPRGRVIEVYGPESSGKTTLALQVVASAQKLGGIAAYIDAEHALDPDYAEKIGVDIDQMLISQPDSGEQALEIAETLVRSASVDVIVIDSVAALVPRAEIDGEMGDSHMGLQARLMSQALRKLTAIVSSSNTCFIFINQLRDKIGVMFGCFQYNSRVVLADGTTEKIGKIVNQKLPVEVLSYNAVTREIEPRKVVNWFDNGNADYFLQFEVEGGKSGKRKFAVTPNHTIYTSDGECSADELSVGDEVLVTVHDYNLTEDQRQLVLGSSLGDGSLRRTGTHTANFRVGHGTQQAEYANWKYEMLSPIARQFGKVGNGFGFDTFACPSMADFRAHLYNSEGKRTVSKEALNALDARGLAAWYSDDGTFGGNYKHWGNGKSSLYNASLKGADREKVVDYFEKIGIGRPQDFGRGFRFNSEQTRRLHERIAPYVHPSMEYKIHPKLRGKFCWLPSDEKLNRQDLKYLRAVPAKITKIYKKPPTRSMKRFDLEVEGNHTYLVDGVVVHNSPETTTGGKALKFYASVRIDIRRIGAIKDGDKMVGNRTRVKVVKNKVAPPFHECEFDIMYGEGISKEGDLLDLAVTHEIVDKSGAWFSYGDERLGQGRENVKKMFKENQDVYERIEHDTKVALGLIKVESKEDKKAQTKTSDTD
ncbi:intein-containing recombinase RecA [soil metagenome]